jgi:lipopolysaccharide export system permease protein
MTLFDRYVLGLFLKIMLVCFTSLAGLYLIIDVFNNLDDFAQIGKREGSLWQVLAAYYAPRILGLLCEVSGLLYLLAAICTLTRLQTTNELAAVQAAGISVRRVARPILVLTALLCGLTWGAREMVLPKFRATLATTPQEILRDKPRPIVSQIDYDSLIMFRGQEILLSEKIVHGVDLQLPQDWTTYWGEHAPPSLQIKAKAAVWLPADEQHPAGFLLSEIQTPVIPTRLTSVSQQGETRMLMPSDQDWLAADQCFVPTPLTVWHLAYGASWFRTAPLAELIAANRSGSVRLPSVQRVELHWRLLRPVLDFLLLLIGLPLVMRPGGQKLVVAAGYCAILMLGMQLFVMACQFLGGQQILKPAALAAWLPILVSVPLATWAYQKFDY